LSDTGSFSQAIHQPNSLIFQGELLALATKPGLRKYTNYVQYFPQILSLEGGMVSKSLKKKNRWDEGVGRERGENEESGIEFVE
jgi:hypothetical protein